MIRHCVLFRTRADVSQQGTEALLSDFKNLVGQIDGLTDIVAGTNISTEGVDQGFRHGFTADFADAKALENYLVDPLHTVLGGRLVSSLTDIKQDLIVWDVQF